MAVIIPTEADRANARYYGVDPQEWAEARADYPDVDQAELASAILGLEV